MKKKRVNRRGIRLLSSDDDLEAHFIGGSEENAQAEDFATLMESSLAPGRVLRAAAEKEHDRDAHRPMRMAEKLRRYPKPQEELDLHHRTATEAQSRVRYGIADAAKRGLKTLRIITGRGIHSESGAVLRGVVEQVLSALKRSGAVFTFVWEKGDKSRSGAVIVYLPMASQNAHRDW